MTETERGTLSNGYDLSQPHEEHQYLDLIRNILEDGEHRPDRYSQRFPCSQLCPTLTLAKNRNRYPFPLCTSSPPLLPLAALTRFLVTPDPGTATSDHQTGLPPRRHRGTSLVHYRLHFVLASL